MVAQHTFLFIALLLLEAPATMGPRSLVHQAAPSRVGCTALDKTRPALYISFESTTDKVWAGDRYEKGVLLRVSNNTDCEISLVVPPDVGREVPPTFGVRGGKLVRLPDVRIGSVKNGANLSLYYLTKYPGEETLFIGGDFHVYRDTVYLNGGDHIFFSVPLRNFKRRGQVLVPFNYEWESGDAAYVKADGVWVEAVKHYLTFGFERLPKEVLR